jgi:Fanconi anemia group M protein
MYSVELIESQGSPSLKAFLERIERDGGKAHRSLLNDNRIKEIQTLLSSLKIEHPKSKYLVELLNQYYDASQSNRNNNNNSNNTNIRKSSDRTNTRLKALVFTHYRDTARRVVEILTENGIKASRFVGQAKREIDIGMDQNEQSAILQSFRNGEFDVLVATSIAEEGLDIPQVDLVVFYEPIPSEIRYIQRRGRTGRKSSGRVIILAAKDTVDERYLYASKRRMEKMKQILSTVNMTLKPVQRADILSDPMTSDETSSFEFKRYTFGKRVDKKLSSTIGITRNAVDLPSSLASTSRLVRTWAVDSEDNDKNKKIGGLLSRESGTATIGFRKVVNSAARRIHALIAKSGRQGLDIDIIQETFAFEDSVLLEALKKLEKLNTIQWLDDTRVILSENLEKTSGSTIDVYVEKIVQGGALVTVNEKWHARLNHYDYEGPRELLKRIGIQSHR